jgi:hypothetical protein
MNDAEPDGRARGQAAVDELYKAACNPLDSPYVARMAGTGRIKRSSVHVLDLESRVAKIEAWIDSVSKPYARAPGTFIGAARDVLVEAGAPLHILEVIARIQAKGIGVGRTVEQVRTSLVPSLHRKPKVFRRTAPATYTARVPPGREKPRP